MPQQTGEFSEHDHIPVEPEPIEPWHPTEGGWSLEEPAAPATPPEGATFGQWNLLTMPWYPNDDPDNPEAVGETYYLWDWIELPPPTEAELAMLAARALLEQLRDRRTEIQAIIDAPVVRSITIPGFDVTLARFSDLEDMRNNQVALSEILLDLMEAAINVVEASSLQGVSVQTTNQSEGGA